MHKILLCSLIVSGCVHLSHVEPASRSPSEQERAAVKIESTCDSIVTEFPVISIGTGVVISERHVLTAAHVVECHALPDIRLTLSNGRRVLAEVTEIDRENDIAKIEIGSADNFGLNVKPPTIALPTPVPACFVSAYPVLGTSCGEFMGEGEWSFESVPGNSGSGVYIDGALVGLIVTTHRITYVAPGWLQGT